MGGVEKRTVQRKRVRVRIIFERVIWVPEDWDRDMVEFWLNDSSHCLANEVRHDEIEEIDNDDSSCGLCLREGTRGEVVDMTPPEDSSSS